MTKADCFELGYITRPHGLDGRLAVVLDVDNPTDYKDTKVVLLEIKGQLVPYTIQSLHFMPNKIVAKFENIDHIDQAETLKSIKMFLPLDKLPKLDEGQFYYHDLIGYDLHDTEEGNVGQIKLIYYMPGQDLLAVAHKGVEVLVPITDEIVLRVDHEAKVVYADLPAGLLDVYLQP
jgi:16S rRNA processing protein RimM